MGLNRNELPDALLRRVSPQDRKSVGLPPPMSEIVSRAAAKSDAKREKDLQNKIENFLRLRGTTVLRPRMDKKTRIKKGWPDFTFAIKGRAVAMEAKLPGENPSEAQAKKLSALAKDGWAIKVVYSLDEARFFVAALL